MARIADKNFPLAGYSASARRHGRRAKRQERRSMRTYERFGNGSYKAPSSKRSVYRANLEADRYIRDVNRQTAKGLFDEQPDGGSVSNS